MLTLETIVQELEYRQTHEQIRYFVPHAGQQEFVKLIDGGFIIISGAGNGWGKSEIIAAIFASAMWPMLAPQSLSIQAFQDWKFPKRARIYSKPAELEEIGSLQTAIKRLFPANRYSVEKGRYSYPSVIRTDTGWILDLFSYERHESEAAGPNIGLQAVNEPPPELLWKEIIARSRSGGYIIGGMTSLLDNPWVVSGILEKANGKDIRVRYGNSCENCRQHGVNGHLEHERIEQILNQYDADEREARFSGKPLSFSGRIYKLFDRAVHVSKDPLTVPEKASIYQVVDPAIGKPLAVIWAYVDPTKTIHIYDEWPEQDFEGMKDSNMTVTDYANLFKTREGGKRIQQRILDRHFGNVRRTLGGSTLKEEFDNVGIEFTDSYTMDPQVEVETGILKVKEYLRYDVNKPLDALNRPKIIISPTCKNTIQSFERWSRNPDTGKAKEEFKDFADLVRYLVMAEPEIESSRPWPNVTRPYYGVS